MISRAVILDNKKILLIHRFNKGREYYVIPGGHIEKGESQEQALIREIKEETGLDVKISKKLWSLENSYDKSTHHFFLVTEFSGKLELGGPEAGYQSETNRFILEWHDLEEVANLMVVPEPAKEKIIELFLK